MTNRTELETLARSATEAIESKHLTKRERAVESPQGVTIKVQGRDMLNFSSNNYLGLANDPEVLQSAHEALDQFGFGLASVRFISGTQIQHRLLEQELAAFFGMENAILYSSAFDANAGIFEALLTSDDAVLSDELNHASIIDGVRLCKASVHRYRHGDMADLEQSLEETQSKRLRLIVTDGVFSMDGEIAKLREICDLADRYHAAVLVDDSHGTGVLGNNGRGSPELTETLDRIDLITSTFSKAFGGGAGGYTVGPKEVIELLRQKSRPYIFSNSLLPMSVAVARTVLKSTPAYAERRKRLMANAELFRMKMQERGFRVADGSHPIVPVMLGEAAVAQAMTKGMLERGIYVIGFWYPVVPEGKARIRVQLTAQHTEEHIAQAIEAFSAVGRELGVILKE